MNLNPLREGMISLYTGDAKRIQHFIKVHAFAKLIGESEGLEGETLDILEIAALVHDIGIKECERKYGECGGKLQEREGPPIAEGMLKALGFPDKIIGRVKYLVAHHHTYDCIEGIDYRILVEADFLVNLYEDGVPKEAAAAAYDRIFVTDTGRRLCREMFGL